MKDMICIVFHVIKDTIFDIKLGIFKMHEKIFLIWILIQEKDHENNQKPILHVAPIRFVVIPILLLCLS